MATERSLQLPTQPHDPSQLSLELTRNQILNLSSDQIQSLSAIQCYYYAGQIISASSLLMLFLREAIRDTDNRRDSVGSSETDECQRACINIIQSDPDTACSNWENDAQIGDVLIVYHNSNWCAFEKDANGTIEMHNQKAAYFPAIVPILMQYLEEDAPPISGNDSAIIRTFFNTRLEKWELDDPEKVPLLLSKGQEVLTKAEKAAFRYALSCYAEPEDEPYLQQAFQIAYDACPQAVIARTKALANRLFELGNRAKSWQQNSQEQDPNSTSKAITRSGSKDTSILTPDYYTNLCLIDIYNIHRQLWQYARLQAPDNPQGLYNEIILCQHRCDLDTLKQNCINLMSDPNVIKLSPESKIKIYQILEWCCEVALDDSGNALIQLEQQCYGEVLRHLQATRLSTNETKTLKPKLYHLQRALNEAIADQNAAQLKMVLNLLQTETLPSLEKITQTLSTPTPGELLAESRATLYRHVSQENIKPENQPAQTCNAHAI